jgi:putative transposase
MVLLREVIISVSVASVEGFDILSYYSVKEARAMLVISPKLQPHFKGFCSSSSVIMLFVYMKCRFSLSYRDLEEIMHIRGAYIDHSTLQRWVRRFSKLIDQRVRAHKKPLNGSWRMDESYIKLNDHH